MTIKLEHTVFRERYNLVDTSKTGNDYYIRQMSRSEVVGLMNNICDTLLE